MMRSHARTPACPPHPRLTCASPHTAWQDTVLDKMTMQRYVRPCSATRAVGSASISIIFVHMHNIYIYIYIICIYIHIYNTGNRNSSAKRIIHHFCLFSFLLPA